jgi:hypothetical protein
VGAGERAQHEGGQAVLRIELAPLAKFSMWRWMLRGVSVSAALGVVIACAQGQSSVEVDGASFSPPDGGSSGSDASRPPARDGGGTTIPDDDSGSGTGCTGKVVINELQCAGPGNAEFIELFNPNDCAINLAGWSIPYKAKNGNSGVAMHAFQPGDTIPAGEFLLLANAAFGGGPTVTALNGTGGLGNDGGQIALVDDDGKQVDAVGYGPTTTGTYTEGAPAPLPTGSGSIGRKSDGLDTDDNSADFRTFSTPSPGVGN